MLEWWEMLESEDRSEMQRFIADAARAYQEQPDAARMAKKDCIHKFTISEPQYDWALKYLTGCSPNQLNQISAFSLIIFMSFIIVCNFVCGYITPICMS